MDWMRAEVREWWKDFPEHPLLAELYRRAARRREKGGPRDSRHRPTHEEGLRVAKPMLANIANADQLDFEWESKVVSITLADQWVFLDGNRRPAELQDYIDRFRSSWAHFDALGHIVEKLHRRGEPIPRSLARWREEVASGAPAASRQEASSAPSPRQNGPARARRRHAIRHRGPAQGSDTADGHSRLRLSHRVGGAEADCFSNGSH